MAKLPDASALGENPVPMLPHRTPMIANVRAGGFEEMPAQELAQSGAQLEQASHAALQAKIAQDAIRVDDMDTQAKQAAMDLTFGADGFTKKRGSDAVNTPLLKDYGAKFDAVAQKLEGQLDNDFQKQTFRKRAQALGIGLREDMVKHIAHQSDVYAATTFKSGMDVDAKLAGQRWSEPDSDVRAFASMQNRIEREADRNGLRGETRETWLKEQMMAARSQVRVEAVQAALVSDPVKGPFAAEAILKTHGNEISPAARVVLTHQVKAAITPIEVAHDAERAVKGVLSGLTADVATNAPGTARAVSSEVVPGGVPYKFQTPQGTTVEGTAPSEAEAYKRMRLGSGLPATPQGQTRRDTAALLGDAIAQAEQYASERKPGDLHYRDQVVQSVKGYFGTIVATHDAQQKGAIEQLLKAINPAQGTGITMKEQLTGNPQLRAAYDSLDPSQQFGIDGHIHQQLLRAQGLETHVAPATVATLSSRIFAASDDPNKIRNITQIVPLLDPSNPLHINTSTFGFLSGLIDKSQSVNGQKFATAAQRAYQSARSTLAHSLVGSVNPDAAADAANQYYIELQNKIDEYQADPKKDARTLLTPGTPDSMVDRAKIMSYLQITPRAALQQDSAAKKAAAATPVVTLKADNLEADFDALQPGARYRAPDDPAGSFRTKPGQAAPASPAPAPQAQKPPIYESFIKPKPRGGFTVEAPARSPSRQLSGRFFATREEAMQALREIYEGGK